MIRTCTLLLLAGGAYVQQKTVRILAIGSSFSQDTVEQYLHELAKAEDISTIIGNIFISGRSLKRHVKNACEDASAYAYRKIGTDGKRREEGKMSLEMVLADEDWDYVSLQQTSTFFGMCKTYEASLPELIECVKTRLPKRTKLMLH